ncbi:MAD2L1-binding protein isoform 2-T2 [Anomaloglossus baeobatrachus]|uniref:MAD2L1-binding protein isoform X1 n=2 Tax=Anomaloglossus baeobatrachus TaxID=238106 RepID=UPI003F507320
MTKAQAAERAWKMEKPDPQPLSCRPRGSRPTRRSSRDDPDVCVVFPGLVTRESCCRFTCELLKHILHQRHQLPLPYEQLLHFCTGQQDGEEVVRRPIKEASDSRHCQRALADLEELISQLDVFFTLTPVPRVLLLLGGSPVSPKELYVIDMEGILVGNGEQSLCPRPCLRQLFRALFVADPFSDLRSSGLMSLVLMVQGHRDCATDWFRPKLNYKVPTRGHTLTIKLSSCGADGAPDHSDDYIWFQAPVTLKGFQN